MYWRDRTSKEVGKKPGSSFEILGHIEDLTTEILFRTLGGSAQDARLADEAHRLATEAEQIVARSPDSSRTPLIQRARRLEGLYGVLASASR